MLTIVNTKTRTKRMTIIFDIKIFFILLSFILGSKQLNRQTNELRIYFIIYLQDSSSHSSPTINNFASVPN